MTTMAAIRPQQLNSLTRATGPEVSTITPIYDAILDLPHPGASTKANALPPRYLPVSPQGLSEKDKAVIQELVSEKTVQRVSNFCFPNFNPANVSSNTNADSSRLTKYDIYATQFTSKSFLMEIQLQQLGGIRVMGYIRLYLPNHVCAKGRTDVGRRSTRALVILARRAEESNTVLYESLLSTLESIASCESASVTKGEDAFEATTLNWKALGGKLARAAKTSSPGKILSLSGLEFSNELFNTVDLNSFGFYGGGVLDMAIMPFLRRMGPSIVLRILSAVLCESRIVLMSTSPQRLTHAIAYAIPAILGCGMLEWQHLRVPLVPPSMMGHLAAPCPYICGILSQYHIILKGMDNLGQLLLVDMDTCELHVYGTLQVNAHVAFPDLLRPIAAVDARYSQQASYGASGASSHGSVESMARGQAAVTTPAAIGGFDSPAQQHATLTEVLATELTELLRYDKVNWCMTVGASGRAADAVAESFSAVTSKAGKGLKRFFGKKSSNVGVGSVSNLSQQQGNSNRTVTDYGDSVNGEEGESIDEDDMNTEEQRRVQEVLNNFWQDEFAYSLKTEEDARVAFTSYFCCLLGEYSTYISRDPNNPGGLIFDKVKYMQQRKLRGDYEGTPMEALLQQFVQSQMLTQFVQQRIKSIAEQMKNPTATPNGTSKCLMEAAIEQLRQSKLDYSLPTVRRVVQQISSTRNSQTLQNVQLARDRVLALTSKNGYEMNRNARADLIQLTEACRRIPMIRLATLSVLWYRIADSKGMQSKHALLSLIILKNLLLNGPLACISEIAQYSHVVRVLRIYQSRLSAVNARDIRSKACEVYELLMDRSKLFTERRANAAFRREVVLMQKQPNSNGIQQLPIRAKKSLVKESRLVGRDGLEWGRLKFTQVHTITKPEGALCAAVPTAADLLDFGDIAPTTIANSDAQSQQELLSTNLYQTDLDDIFSFSAPPPSTNALSTPNIQSSINNTPTQDVSSTTTVNTIFDMTDLFNAATTSQNAKSNSITPVDPARVIQKSGPSPPSANSLEYKVSSTSVAPNRGVGSPHLIMPPVSAGGFPSAAINPTQPLLSIDQSKTHSSWQSVPNQYQGAQSSLPASGNLGRIQNTQWQQQNHPQQLQQIWNQVPQHQSVYSGLTHQQQLQNAPQVYSSGGYIGGGPPPLSSLQDNNPATFRFQNPDTNQTPQKTASQPQQKPKPSIQFDPFA